MELRHCINYSFSDYSWMHYLLSHNLHNRLYKPRGRKACLKNQDFVVVRNAMKCLDHPCLSLEVSRMRGGLAP